MMQAKIIDKRKNLATANQQYERSASTMHQQKTKNEQRKQSNVAIPKWKMERTSNI